MTTGRVGLAPAETQPKSEAQLILTAFLKISDLLGLKVLGSNPKRWPNGQFCHSPTVI